MPIHYTTNSGKPSKEAVLARLRRSIGVASYYETGINVYYNITLSTTLCIKLIKIVYGKFNKYYKKDTLQRLCAIELSKRKSYKDIPYYLIERIDYYNLQCNISKRNKYLNFDIIYFKNMNKLKNINI